MNGLTGNRPLTRAMRRGTHIGWVLWTALLIVAWSVALGYSDRSVTKNYHAGTNEWLREGNLYNGTGTGFIYLPQAAILFAPFNALPYRVGEVLWRCTAIGLFSFGVWRFSQLSGDDKGGKLFTFMSLVCIPLCWSCARNGQSTLPMAGLMMLAVAAMTRRHWWPAAGYLSLALAIKPLAIVLILLAGAVQPQMRWRQAVGLVVVFAFPFALGSPEYVCAQYREFFDLLRMRHESSYWAQVFGVLKIAGVETSSSTELMIRCGVAVCTLGLCIWLMRRHSPNQAHVLLYSLATIYLMLFGPRTENNTYAMFGPVLAAITAQALLIERRYAIGWYYLGCGVAILASYEIGKLVVPPQQAVWLAPVGCMAFSIVHVWDACRKAAGGTTARTIADTPMCDYLETATFHWNPARPPRPVDTMVRMRKR